MSSQALQLVPGAEPEAAPAKVTSSLQLRTLDDLMRLGEIFARSGYFSDAKDAAKAVVKILAGQDMGLSPFAAMNGIYLSSQGRLGYSANLIAAQIKNSGRYDYRVREWTDDGCKIEFFDRGQSVGFGEFTREDAIRAGLANKDTYKGYPKGLFFARALTQGARAFTPELFGGNAIYTQEELESAPPAHAGPFNPMHAESPALIEPETAERILQLWPEHGLKSRDGARVEILDYLKEKKGISDIYSMEAQSGAELLRWLEARARARTESEEKAAGAGLDQWRCTQESGGSRRLAMELLTATARLEKTGIPEAQWRKELHRMFPEYEPPISRKTLSPAECEIWINTLTVWAEKRERGTEEAHGN